MSRSINAASVQFNITLGEIEPNLDKVRTALAKLAKEGVQLVVLPEMWATGFAYKDLNRLAARTEEIVGKISRLSAEYSMVIVGSLPEPHENKVYNTAYLLDNGVLLGKYRKMHLFSLMQEDRSFDSGDSWLVADTSVGRVGVIICYDLRFPELARRLAVEGAEIIAVPGEWPKPREEHWRALLRARAIENQLYVVSANCCGVTGKLDFFGMSMVINHMGEIISEAGYDEENITAVMDFDKMKTWREQIPCFKDRKAECY